MYTKRRFMIQYDEEKGIIIFKLKCYVIMFAHK